jgi:Trk K+ transport system NAD-binding subunit
VCKRIVFLGFYREASSILAELEKAAPEGQRNPLLDEIMVIDFNPHVINELNNRKIKSIYGDVASMDTLKHAHLDSAKIVISSMDDSVMRGTNNHKILNMVRNIAPKSEVMVASNNIKHALELYEQGADFVLVNRIHSSKDIAELINNSLDKGLKQYRDSEIKNLSVRKEVLN